jgi:signal transduction histidine kinase
MQAPQSNTAARKHGSPEIPHSSQPRSAVDPFFAERSAAAAKAAKAAGDVAPEKAARSAVTPHPAAAGATAAAAARASEQPSKPSKLPDLGIPGRGLPDLGRDRAKVSAHITDRRTESRRADDTPASNRPAREWIRPGWMTQDPDPLAPGGQGARSSSRARGVQAGTVQKPRAGVTPHDTKRLQQDAAEEPGAAAAVPPAAFAAQVGPEEPGTGAAGLAHDAGNLLAALMLYSELLAFPDVLHERHRHYADDLKLLAERSRTLIDRLVSFGGAVDHERAVTQGPGSLSLVDVLMRCEGLLSTLTRGSLQVTFGAQAALPVAIAPEPLERILVNLVKNAAQATRNGGAVRIGVGLGVEAAAAQLFLSPGGAAPAVSRLPLAPPRYRSAARNQSRPGAKENPRGAARMMLLTVEDSGCGMTEQQVARLLRPEAAIPEVGFAEAADTGQRQGVGLRVVRELVAASGGRLAIASRVGVGTHIEIQWPVTEGEMLERGEGISASSSLAPAAREGGGPDSHSDARSDAHADKWSKPKAESASRGATAMPGILPRLEMVAEPRESLSQGGFAEVPGFAGGHREAERRLLTEQNRREEGRPVSDNTDFQRFTNDAKGAIAC